jgi:hypothetical protein
MKYVVIKYVEASNQAEALRKSKKIPVHEIYIHNPSWEKNEYSLKELKNKKIGYEHGKKK